MVGVAQLVEPRVVISAVVGSSPIVHPISRVLRTLRLWRAVCGPPARRWRRCRRRRSAALRGGRFDGLVLQGQSQEPAGLGRGAAAVVRRGEAARRGRRARRTQQPHVHHRRPLGPDARELRAGDFVIIQFGHNDSGALNQEPPGSTRPLRARGTIPGIGDESEEIDNVITGKHETVYSFGWYLRKMIADTRAKGATPILSR